MPSPFPGSQKRTFLPYTDGLLPEELRLGSLYINPLDPVDGRSSERFEFMDSEDDQKVYEQAVSKWTRKRAKEVRPFKVHFQASKARSVGACFTQLLSFNASSNEDVTLTIEGDMGRCVRIKDNVAFLEEVMKQPGVKEWMCEHASIAHAGGDKWKAPKIWMVTALQYVTNGKLHSEIGNSTKVGGAVGFDAGPLLNAPPGPAKAQIEGCRQRENAVINDNGYEHEMVWAAQFMPVAIRYGPEEDTELSTKAKRIPKTVTGFRLLEVPDLANGGIRGEPAARSVSKLYARVVVEEEDHEAEDSDEFVIDDTEYVANKTETNWKQYDECKALLREREEEDFED